MNEEKLKQYLYEHPELLDDAFRGSLTEANRWAQEHARTPEEMIALAREKHPEIPAEAWADFEKAAAKRHKSKRRAPIVHIRWWQIAVAAVIILVLTFTLVPPARALAESVARYIVHIFNDGIAIQREDDTAVWNFETLSPISEGMGTPVPEEIPEDDSDIDYIDTTYPDIPTFTEETGYRPVLVVSDDFRIQLIEYRSVPNVFDEICITYESENGTPVYIYQIWGEERGGFISKDENDVMLQTTVLDGAKVIGYIDNIDHEYVIEIILEDSNMTIMYLGDVDYQTILDALQYVD